MADGYLEKHQEDYEARREAWLRQKGRRPKTSLRQNKLRPTIERPDDESL